MVKLGFKESVGQGLWKGGEKGWDKIISEIRLKSQFEK